MLTTNIVRFFIVLSLVAIAGCQSSNVAVDYDTQQDFSAFSHFQWYEPEPAAAETSLYYDRAKAAASRQLVNAGFTEVASRAEANVLLQLQVSSEILEEDNQPSASVGIGGGSGGSGIGLALRLPLGTNTPVTRLQIFVDILSPESKKLKWRGRNMLRVSDQTPEKIAQLVSKAVDEIFQQYPPQREQAEGTTPSS